MHHSVSTWRQTRKLANRLVQGTPKSLLFLYFSNDMGRDQADTELAVPLFHGQFAGAATWCSPRRCSAPAWKKHEEYPSEQPVRSCGGYNQQLVLQKLHGCKDQYPIYVIAKRREVSAGETARF